MFAPRLFRRSFATRNPLPATFYRGGTSKGIFLNRAHLPALPADWAPILHGIMGSPDSYGRQLNGMGGGSSSTSKIVIVGPGGAQGIDVDYTVVQVGIEDGVLDTTGNCGNLTAAVGAFAAGEGLVPRVTSRGLMLRNTNTAKKIRAVFPVDARGNPDLGRDELSITGVTGTASRVRLEVFDPMGTKTGKILPSGKSRDSVKMTFPHPDGPGKFPKTTILRISIVDAANPTVFIRASKLNDLLENRKQPTVPESSAQEFVDAEFGPEALSALEEIRTKAAKLAKMEPAQGQPKICVVRARNDDEPSDHDISAKTLSMGVLHRTIPSTVALCIAASAGIPQTIVNDDINGGPGLVPEEGQPRPEKIETRIKIPGGVVDVVGNFTNDGYCRSVAMDRTARKLMKGEVYW